MQVLERRFEQTPFASGRAVDDGSATSVVIASGGIPRIIHHIWLGSALPERFAFLRQTWIDRHPVEDGWTHMLWGTSSTLRGGRPSLNVAIVKAAHIKIAIMIIMDDVTYPVPCMPYVDIVCSCCCMCVVAYHSLTSSASSASLAAQRPFATNRPR